MRERGRGRTDRTGQLPRRVRQGKRGRQTGRTKRERESKKDAPFPTPPILLLRIRPRQRLRNLLRRRPRQPLHLRLQFPFTLIPETPRRLTLGDVDASGEGNFGADFALRFHPVFRAGRGDERAVVDEAGVEAVDGVGAGGETGRGALDRAEKLWEVGGSKESEVEALMKR